MNIEDILMLETFDKKLTALCVDPVDRNIGTAQEQYDGRHVILKRAKRYKGEGSTREEVEVAREVVTFQKKIVGTAVSFLFGEPVRLILNDGDDEAFTSLIDVWKENKLDYFNRKLARVNFIETKTAELWYILKEEGQDAKIKVMLLSKKNGDEFFPHFNNYGDMDAFTRKYEQDNETGKSTKHADIYMADKTIHAEKIGGQWNVIEEKNLVGKITVIYYEQEEPEWADVQTLIDRIESMISKFADTNDYFGSPILKLKGKLKNAPSKEEVGKLLDFAGEEDDTGTTTYPGDAAYLVWEQGPESTKIEYEILKDLIYGMTSTPDLTFNNVKGMGNTSGIALRLLFSDSIFKAMDKEELFGEGITRRINLLKQMLATTNVASASKFEELDISLEFGSVLPTDTEAIVKSLSLARSGEPIMSEEEAVSKNPLVSDPVADLGKLAEEKKMMSSLGDSFEV